MDIFRLFGGFTYCAVLGSHVKPLVFFLMQTQLVTLLLELKKHKTKQKSLKFKDFPAMSAVSLSQNGCL